MSDTQSHGNGHDEHAAGHGHDDHGHGHAGVRPEHVIRDEGHGHDDHAPAEPEFLRDTPLGPARKSVTVDDVEFSLIDEGSGPAILFLHGFPTSASLWRHVIGGLAKAHRCIAPDLLGFGWTECSADADFDLDRQAELVLRLLDAMGVTGEVAVVGHDIGGIVAQVIAATAPERVSKLVLIDSPAFSSDPPPVVRRLTAAARFTFVWDFLADTGFLRWFASSEGGIRAGAYEPSAITDEAIAEYIGPIYRDTPPAYREARERFRRALKRIVPNEAEVLPVVAEGLRRFEKPTLVIWGCDDPYISLSWGKKLADEVPGCVGFELIPFCGHWVPEEKPELLGSLIAAHMQTAGGALATAAAAAAGAAADAGAKVAAAAEQSVPE